MTEQTKMNSTNVKRYSFTMQKRLKSIVRHIKNFTSHYSYIYLIIITDTSIHWESYIILKTKYIERLRILNELLMFFDIHKDLSTHDLRNGLFVNQ